MVGQVLGIQDALHCTHLVPGMYACGVIARLQDCQHQRPHELNASVMPETTWHCFNLHMAGAFQNAALLAEMVAHQQAGNKKLHLTPNLNSIFHNSLR